MLCPSFPSSPFKHPALAFTSKLQRGTSSEWASKEQCRKGVFGAHSQAETQQNEELTWDQTESHFVCKTLVHYVGLNFQQENKKAPKETEGLSLVGAHPTGPLPTQLLLQICNMKILCIPEWQNKNAIIFVREKLRICSLVFFLRLCMYLFWTFMNKSFEENNKQ